jgi:acyl-CoA reductase-like NAD-dependent aldehyde dehydrogenase
VIGDPSTCRGNQHGPLSSNEEYRRVMDCIEALTKLGGVLATSGPKHDVPAKGYFVRPTVLHGFPDPQAVMGDVDVIPGPVICVAKYNDLAQAVRQANAIVQAGIGGTSAVAVFSDDVSEVQCLCHPGVLRASAVVVNSLDDEPVRRIEDAAARRMFVNEKTVVLFQGDTEDIWSHPAEHRLVTPTASASASPMSKEQLRQRFDTTEHMAM